MQVWVLRKHYDEGSVILGVFATAEDAMRAQPADWKPGKDWWFAGEHWLKAEYSIVGYRLGEYVPEEEEVTR